MEGTGILTIERTYLKENQKALREEYPGKYLLISGTQVHGAFETEQEGVAAGVEMFALQGAFLVRNVERVDDIEISVPALSVGVPLSCPS